VRLSRLPHRHTLTSRAVTLYAIILISLATRAHALNRPFIWAEPIAELPWFGQFPGMEDDEEGSADDGGDGSRRTSRYGAWDPRMGMYPPGGFQNGYYPNGQMLGMQPGMTQPVLTPQGYVIQVGRRACASASAMSADARRSNSPGTRSSSSRARPAACPRSVRCRRCPRASRARTAARLLAYRCVFAVHALFLSARARPACNSVHISRWNRTLRHLPSCPCVCGRNKA
jgi:hypothetical protein